MSNAPAKNRSLQRFLLPGSAALLLLLTVIQLGLYLYGYDFAAELYLPGALPSVTALVWILAATGAALLALPLPGKLPCRELKIPSSLLTDYAALLTMASLVSTVVLPLLGIDNDDPLGALLTSTNLSDNTARTMLRLSLILAVLAAIHFLLQFVYRKVHPLGVTAMLLWAGFSALRIYFDMRYLLMSPRRVLHLVALVALLLFFVAELRLARGIATPRFYTMIAAPTMVIAGADAITNLILTAMGWITPGSEICTYFVLLAVAVYCFARLRSVLMPPKQTTVKASAPTETAAEEVSVHEIASDALSAEKSPDETSSPDFPPAESPDEEHAPQESPETAEESPE